MSLSGQVDAALTAGAERMRDAMGVTLEVHDPRTGTTYEVSAHYQALRELAELEGGGYQLEQSADAWWSRSETPEPEVGWMVKVSGRILRVREVVDDPLDDEWSVRLEAV